MTLRELLALHPSESTFWSRFRVAGDCWEWTGYVADTGYGRLIIASSPTRYLLIHRYAFSLVHGPLAPGLQVHHKCRNRKCGNPAHLMAVTSKEHHRLDDTLTGRKARQTHCVHGHPFDEANTRRSKDGRRYCMLCNRERAFARYQVKGKYERLHRLGRLP